MDVLFPQSAIVCSSLIPRCRVDARRRGPSLKQINDTILHINHIVSGICTNEENLIYLDLYTVFLEKFGLPRRDITVNFKVDNLLRFLHDNSKYLTFLRPDGLHPKDEGKQVINYVLSEVVWKIKKGCADR